MVILVVGGAGYIGSLMVKQLLRAGYRVVVLDNFSTGHRDALVGGELVEANLAHAATLNALFMTHAIDAVLHFASFIQVGESVRHPGRYYGNNFSATLTLLEAMVQAGVSRFIFSSSAAVYGTPRDAAPMDEEHPKEPLNPYGRSKWMVEQLLDDFAVAHGVNFVALRYFNAAGADPEGGLGERHLPETHLIPVLLQVASGRQARVVVHGQDYPTPDGTCIRDYVHVADLCQAHLRALEYLLDGGESTVCNLGNGAGFSVNEVIATVERVTGKPLPVVYGPRRPGDSARLVANARKASVLLDWQPRWSDLQAIVAHAWRFEREMVWM
ncbi:MAG: UDP-glucose 4-epimerase GalE [Magnetococcales bacterium]|nr:UDP-glucose 4-epimerase GalE [Magnetococcales bacterium]